MSTILHFREHEVKICSFFERFAITDRIKTVFISILRDFLLSVEMTIELRIKAKMLYIFAKSNLKKSFRPKGGIFLPFK
jgi:hypothetical protein